MSLITTKLSAEQAIQQLATQYGVTYQRTALDELGDNITRLSDDEVQLDENQWLLIQLGRAGILTDQEHIQLQLQYLQEHGF